MWVLLEIYRSLQKRTNVANRSRIDKVIAMVRVAQFFGLTVYILGYHWLTLAAELVRVPLPHYQLRARLRIR